MKDLRMLVWVTQLGLSIVLPLAGFLLLARWLQNVWGWGEWTLWVGIFLGVITAIEGFRGCLDAMNRLSKPKEKPSQEPPVSFNDHD